MLSQAWRNKMNRALSLGLMVLALLVSSQIMAWKIYDDNDTFYVMAGAYAHFEDDDDYEDAPILASIEIIKPNNHLYGLALFNNSYGQFSQYLYFGKIYKFDDVFNGLRAKVSAGLIHGYRGEFEDNLLLNEELGVAPAIVPGIGYQRKRWGIDLYLLGDQAIFLGIGYQF